MIGFPELVELELAAARRGHKPQNSAHEGYAVLLEEMDELWDEVRKRRHSRSAFKMLGELVQIGAMAQRMAEDVLKSCTAEIPTDVKLFSDGEETYAARTVDDVFKHIIETTGIKESELPRREDMREVPRSSWNGHRYRMESGEQVSFALALYRDLLAGSEMPFLFASTNL